MKIGSLYMNDLTFEQARELVMDFKGKSFTEKILKNVPDYHQIISDIISSIENGNLIDLSTEHINSLIRFNIYIPYLSYCKDIGQDFFDFLDGYIIMLSNFNNYLENDRYTELKKSIYVLEALHKTKDSYETLIFLAEDLLTRYKEQFDRASTDLSIRFVQSFLKDEQNDY